MVIISFGWTAKAISARRKTCTRRDWTDSYARRFRKGDLVQAYDRSPRVGGKRIGTVRLTAEPYQERTCDIPPGDWEAEGFAYLTEIGATVHGKTPADFWRAWKEDSRLVWVVRFEIVELCEEGAVSAGPATSGRTGQMALR